MGNQCFRQCDDGIDVSEDFDTLSENHIHIMSEVQGVGDRSPFPNSCNSRNKANCYNKLKPNLRRLPEPQTQTSNTTHLLLYPSEARDVIHASSRPDDETRARQCNRNDNNVDREGFDRSKLKQMLRMEEGSHEVPKPKEDVRSVNSDALPNRPQNDFVFFSVVSPEIFDRLLSLQHARRTGSIVKFHDRRMRVVETISGCNMSLSPVDRKSPELPMSVPKGQGILRVRIKGRQKENVLRALCELNSRMPELMRSAMAPKNSSPIFSYVIDHGCLSLTEQVAIHFPELLMRSNAWMQPVQKDQYRNRLFLEQSRLRI